MPVTLICKICKSKFSVPPARVRLGQVRYCSKKCKGVDMKKPIARTCEVCGMGFTTTPGRLRQSPCRFCSRDCMRKWQSEFYRGPIHHCWKGGKSYAPYPAEFNERLKSKVRERDEHACALCGHRWERGEILLAVHHIDYNKENSSVKNLVTLCHPCHTRTNANRQYWSSVLTQIMENGHGTSIQLRFAA